MPLDEFAKRNTVVTDAPALPPLNPRPLLDIHQVAQLLNVPPSWVYERTRKRGVDRLPGFRLGKYWRFVKEDVLAWLEQQRVGVRPNA